MWKQLISGVSGAGGKATGRQCQCQCGAHLRSLTSHRLVYSDYGDPVTVLRKETVDIDEKGKVRLIHIYIMEMKQSLYFT
jgi:hypothetical protein